MITYFGVNNIQGVLTIRLIKAFSWIGNLFDGAIIDKIFIDGNGKVLNPCAPP